MKQVEYKTNRGPVEVEEIDDNSTTWFAGFE